MATIHHGSPAERADQEDRQGFDHSGLDAKQHQTLTPPSTPDARAGATAPFAPRETSRGSPGRLPADQVSYSELMDPACIYSITSEKHTSIGHDRLHSADSADTPSLRASGYKLGMWMQVLTLAAVVLGTIGGWIVNGRLQHAEKRRDVRVELLLSAYRRLDAVANRPPPSGQEALDFEAAISDVMLAGSRRQVDLAEEFSHSFAAASAGDDSGGGDLKPLLEDLRSDLRSELKLGEVPPRSVWLRIGNAGPSGSTRRPL